MLEEWLRWGRTVRYVPEKQSCIKSENVEFSSTCVYASREQLLFFQRSLEVGVFGREKFAPIFLSSCHAFISPPKPITVQFAVSNEESIFKARG